MPNRLFSELNTKSTNRDYSNLKKPADSGKDGKREIFLIHPIAQIEKVLSEEDDIAAID